MKIKANGISMNYEVEGDGENLLLIHGAGDNLHTWYYQVPVLSQSYRVITYDIRGHGETESALDDYSMPVFIEDAYELLKATGVNKACVLGFSLGGGIALGLALKYPEMVKALILANTTVGTPPPLRFIEGQRLIKTLLKEGDMRRVAENMTYEAFSPGFRDKNPAEFERCMQVKLRNTVDGMTRLSQSFGAPVKAPDISKLQCPVLVILGENDIIMDVKQIEEAQASIPGSRLVKLPTGHASAIESPAMFNAAVIDFLSELKDG